MDQKERAHYWGHNKHVIALLLVIWGVVSLGGGILGVRWLNQFHVGQLPLGFWIAQQGAIFVFVGLVFAYAIYMDYIDRGHIKNDE